MNAFWRGCTSLLVVAMLSGCTSKGDNDVPNPNPNSPGGGGGGGGGGYEPGVFLPAATFANRCEDPRTGIDPFTNAQYPDVEGSYADENNFLRSWTNDTYLWYDEVPDLDPADHQTQNYFDLLKTSETTASGAPKDKFHFWYDTAEWNQLSESGIVAGYGAAWYIAAEQPPREIVIAYVEPGSPAASAGLERGDEVLQIDGEDAVHGTTGAAIDALNAGLFPASGGESHTFVFRKRSDDSSVEVTLTSDEIVTSPVQNAQVISGEVGYILFNDHIATAESALIDAFEALEAASVSDLILDLRYNGGGYLGIASQVAYMIAGSQTAGQVFERIAFNDKHPTTDPITGANLEPLPFADITLGFDTPEGQPLPTLNLPRVYVLASDATCSASESIINSLRGIDVEVYLIGSTTCGKPYGFYAQDNCGTTYFTIQFQGNNAKGFGDYTDGFSPSNNVIGESVPGCQVADDFEHELGDPNEARLAAALSFRASNNQDCPAPTSFRDDRQLKPGQARHSIGPRMYKSPFHQNRILRRL